MSLTPEDLQALSELMDSKLVNLATKSDLARTEKRLNDRIATTEEILLDEIERVHDILDKHVKDTNKHPA